MSVFVRTSRAVRWKHKKYENPHFNCLAKNCMAASQSASREPTALKRAIEFQVSYIQFAWLWLLFFLYFDIDLDIQLVRKMTTRTRLLFTFHATQLAYNDGSMEVQPDTNKCMFCYEWNKILNVFCFFAGIFFCFCFCCFHFNLIMIHYNHIFFHYKCFVRPSKAAFRRNRYSFCCTLYRLRWEITWYERWDTKAISWKKKNTKEFYARDFFPLAAAAAFTKA